MTTVFIARRGAERTRASQAQLEASRELKVLGVAETLYRAKAALGGLDPDTLLIDLRLEDGAALSLVHGLRERHAERRRQPPQHLRPDRFGNAQHATVPQHQLDHRAGSRTPLRT